MRHRVYSKDAAERTVPQRQENMGKAAVVGRGAERELVKDEKRREETRKESEVERKKKERRKEGRKEKVRKEEREEKGARRQRGNTRKETARTTGKRTGASGIVLPLGDVGSRKGRGPTKWGGSPRGNTISGA